MKKEIIFVRHGETPYNEQGLFAGSTDIPLNTKGRAQAVKAANTLLSGSHKIGRLWTSPLLRARQTAEIIANALRLKVTVVPDLAERNFGEWEGTAKTSRNRLLTPKNGESLQHFYSRSVRAMAFICNHEETPLIVAHSGTFQTFSVILRDKSFLGGIGNGCITRIMVPVSIHEGEPAIQENLD